MDSRERTILVEGTIIHVYEEESEIFQYDYLTLYDLWLDYIHYEPEDPEESEDLDVVEYRREPEGYCISIIGDELFVGLLESADQAGILGIINISTGELIHTQEAAYYFGGVADEKRVVTLHLIHFYGVVPYCQVHIKEKGSLDFSDCDVYFNAPRELELDAREDYSLSLSENSLLLEDSEGKIISVDIGEYLHNNTY